MAVNDPNEGASKQRAEELRQANIEGARFKATMEGLNSVFKDFKANSSDALKTDIELLGQLDGLTKGFRQAIGLADKLKAFTIDDLKNAKKRNEFERKLSDARGDQARVAADIITLEETIADKKNQQKAVTDKISALNKELEKQDFKRDMANMSLNKAKQMELDLMDKIEKQEIELSKLSGDAAAAKQKEIDQSYLDLDLADQRKQRMADRVGQLDEQINKNQEILEANEQINSDLADQIELGEGVLENAKAYKVTIDQTVEASEELAKKIEDVNNATPAFIQAFKEFSKIAGSIPIVGDVLNAVTGDISEAADMFKKLKAEGKSSFEAITKAGQGFIQLGLASAATAFVDAAIKGFKRSSDVMVTLNKSVAGSMVNMSAQQQRVAAAAGKFTVPLEQAAETIAGLNAGLGTALDFTTDTTEQAIKLTNKYGLAADSTAKLLKISAINRDTLGETVDAITGGVAKFNALNGVSLNAKAIMEDIAGASDATLRNLGKNPDAIVRAAAAARSLGMSMDDINAAAESTLDFQNSMAAEMEAELMLGKDLNLDRLRAAAATGDTATQAEEMKRLVMENADAIGNNVLAQENFAKTLGITRDQYMAIRDNQDALAVLTGESGAAEEANAKARMMSQEDLAKSVENSVGKLTSLMDKVTKFTEDISSGAKNFADDIIKGFEEGGFIGGMKNMFEKAFDAILEAFDGKFTGSKAGALLGGLTVAGGAVLTIKAAKGLFDGAKSLFGFGTKKGMDNVEVINGAAKVTMTGGGMGSDLTTQGGSRVFKYLFGKKGNFLGNLTRTMNRGIIKMFGKNKLSKVLGNWSSRINKMKMPNLTRIFSKMKMPNLTSIFSKIKMPNLGSVFSKIKIPTGAAGGLLKTIGGKILAPLELAMGAFKGYDQVANMTDEEKKQAGIRTDMGKAEATILGTLTGGAERGSMISDFVGVEKGSAGDDAMGILGSAGRGAAVGAAIGSIIPGVGTAIGAAAGGIIGGASEAFKVFSDPNSQLRQKVAENLDYMGDKLKEGWENAKAFGSNLKEKLGNAWSSLSEKAGNFKDALSEKLSSGFEFIKGKASEFKDALGERLSSAFNGAKTMATDLFNGVKDKAKSALNAIKETKVGEVATKMAEKVSSTISSGWSAFKGAIGFAEGGVVTKPTLAVIGEGGEEEAVVPLSKAKDMGFGMDIGKLGNLFGSVIKAPMKAVESFSNVLNKDNKETISSAQQHLNKLNEIKEESDRQHRDEIRELKNQTALLYQYIVNPPKSVIKMDSFRVGQSLAGNY